MRDCEHKLKSIETALKAGSPVLSCDTDSMGLGGGAGEKEETQGRCDVEKVAEG